MNIKYPDYRNCIANLACSLLQKDYKNVVLLLLDSMGINVLQKHLSEDGFFRRHLKSVYSSTFPPTTVAATTAVDSGLFPNQSEKQLLGCGNNHAELDNMLGDYLAVAIGDISIGNVPNHFKGNHAGLTTEEMEIPLIAITR